MPPDVRPPDDPGWKTTSAWGLQVTPPARRRAAVAASLSGRCWRPRSCRPSCRLAAHTRRHADGSAAAHGRPGGASHVHGRSYCDHASRRRLRRCDRPDCRRGEQVRGHDHHDRHERLLAVLGAGDRSRIGFVVSTSGLILTANHVVAGNTSLTVTLPDGRQVSATVVSTDPQHDVALIRASATGLVPLPLGDSSNLTVGELAVAVGSPLGRSTTRSRTGSCPPSTAPSPCPSRDPGCRRGCPG